VFTIFGWAAIVSLITYLLPIILVNVLPEQDLRKKYNAKWALVTGGSSGLGFSLADKCASQGLNVVICALDDSLLKTSHRDLVAKYPKLEFRAVGVNLGDQNSTTYMSKIAEATQDIDVQIVFSNAGYLIMKAFYKTDLNQVTTNFNCNAVSHLYLAHHFFNKMVKAQKKGCIVFTSSLVAYFPTPANALYGCAKAALSQLASCLSIEGSAYGIDVMSVQAGPMQTRFTDNLVKIDMLKQFYKVASTPDEVASVLFKSVGRISHRDHSSLNIFFRLLLKVLDSNWLISIISFSQPYTPDWNQYPDLH